MPDQQILDTRVAQYELEIPIDATRSRVWKALTDQLGSWWLPDFQMLGPDSRVALELKAGGRLYEQSENGELLWYSVLSYTTDETLNLVGHCTPEFGGPMTTMLTLRLTDDGDQTRLSITDALYGHVSDGQIESLRSGWQMLFTDGLKAFAEN